jgi:hypothetical protein
MLKSLPGMVDKDGSIEGLGVDKVAETGFELGNVVADGICMSSDIKVESRPSRGFDADVGEVDPSPSPPCRVEMDKGCGA